MRRLALLSLLVLSACASPTRDNGNDPVNAPVPVLRFFDATTVTGACNATLGTAGSIIVLARGRCLGISGFDSTDPQDGAPVSYRFERIDGAVVIPIGTGTTAPAVFLTGQEVRDLNDVVLHFRLTVTDAAGTDVSTEREIQITNDSPVAPHVSSMTIPFGGYPWAPTSLDVRFASGVGQDPNGDAIGQYLWTFPDGTESSPDPLSPLFTRTLDVLDYRPYVATFHVEDDGFAPSEARTVVVNRRPANLWVKSTEGFARTDGLRRSIAFPSLAASGSIFSRYYEPEGSGPRTVVVYDNSAANRSAAVLAWPTLTLPVGTTVPASNQSGFAFSPAGDQLAIVDTDTQTLRRLAYNGSTLSAPLNTAVSMPSEGVGLSPVVEHTLGAIWASRRHENLYAFDPATGLLIRTFTDTLGFQGFAIRPGSGELWMARSVNSSQDPIESARLHRFTSVADPQVFETDEPRVRWLTWADADELWVVLDRETVLVDANVLASGGTFLSAVLMSVPTSEDALYALTDLSNGDVIVVALSGAPVRIRRDGTVTPLSPPGFLEYSDRQGGFWSTSATTLDRSSADGGQTPQTPFFAEGGGGPDGQGGVWTAGGSLFGRNATLIQIAEDGTIARRHDTFIVDGVERPIPNVALFRTEPGTNHAWAQFGSLASGFTSQGVFRIDLSKSPPVGTLVLDSTMSIQLKHPIMEASSPTAATPFTWMIGPNYTMWQVRNDGQVSAAAAGMFPGTFEQFRGARSLVSNGLCLGAARSSGGTGFFRGRWFPSTSPPNEQLLAGITVPNGTSTGPIAVSRQNNGSGDVCWYSYQEPGGGTCIFGNAHVIPYTAGLTTQQFDYTISPPGKIEALYPFNPDRFMVVVTRCTATGNEVRDIELVTRQVTGAFARTTVKSGVTADTFIDWESSAKDSFLLPP